VSELLWPDQSIGIFETLLIVEGLPVELDGHLRRLEASARELFDGETPRGARELVLDRAAGIPLGRLRLTVTPEAKGALGLEVATAAVDPKSVFPSWELAVALRPFVVQGGLGAHKWADREGLAWTESTESDGSLPLVLDAGREVLEASRANVFAVDGDVLITPATDGRILPGVARARAIDAARSLGFEVRETALTLEQLTAVGEAFLTGSVRGIEPVRSVGNAPLRAPGATVSALASELKRLWIGEHAMGPRTAWAGAP
jgi:para-aminobenzoate synthetase/4-amino-4-deoxychorismate lyase